jgi:hypothetical protein
LADRYSDPKTQTDIARLLLTHGADPDRVGFGTPAVVSAAEHENIELVTVLCKEGGAQVDAGDAGDVDRPDNFQRTALSYAAEKDNFKMARALIGLGADVNRPDAGNRPPLVHAAVAGRVGMVRFLLGHGVTYGMGRGLVEAAKKGKAGVLRLLLSEEFRSRFTDRDVFQSGQVLHAAVRSMDVGSVEALLGAGADPLTEDDRGYSSLDLCPPALRSEFAAEPPPITQLLVARLVRLDKFDFRYRLGPGGTTVLDRARKAGYFGLVRYLVIQGARCNDWVSCAGSRFQISALVHMVHQRQMQQGLRALGEALGSVVPEDILSIVAGYGCSVTTWEKAKELLFL